MFRLSIIVPVLNEEKELPGLLTSLDPFLGRGVEVILVDGGSSDGSVAIAERFGLTVVRSSSGRARQMNAGAVLATGHVLLFLHADTRLPLDADSAVAAAIGDSRIAWGRFNVRISGRSTGLKLVGGMMNWRSCLTGIATGDQAIFVTRSAFDHVGGFPDQPLMEDVEISTRLRRLAPPVCLRSRVITSGRRWETRGVWSTVWLMWRLRFAYWRGVPTSVLADLYR